MSARSAKLRDGDWGMRGIGEPPDPGATVLVTKRDGDTREHQVGEIIWSGKDRDSGKPAWLATILPDEDAKPKQTSASKSDEEFWNDESPKAKPASAPTCQHVRRYCQHCGAKL